MNGRLIPALTGNALMRRPLRCSVSVDPRAYGECFLTLVVLLFLFG